jgi:hypothetical protein
MQLRAFLVKNGDKKLLVISGDGEIVRLVVQVGWMTKCPAVLPVLTASVLG